MTNYNKLYEVAADNYGLITNEQAHDIGVPTRNLNDLARRPLQGGDGHVHAAGRFGTCGDHMEQDWQGSGAVHVQRKGYVDGHAHVCR